MKPQALRLPLPAARPVADEAPPRGAGAFLERWTKWAWPLPALCAWALAWCTCLALQTAAGGTAWPWLAGTAVGAALAWPVAGRWRQLLVAAGFPLSALATGATAPAWAWGVAAAVLLLAYPLRAWRDAPFFPTPVDALAALSSALPLRDGAVVLDAGCGLGHGLLALQRAWPQAQLRGVEWSAPLALWARLRCRGASVRRGDMWVDDWRHCDVVYLFQRPESMPRAWTKACAEMAPGAHLVSLEFAVPGVEPLFRLDAGAGRPLWVYRIPGRGRPTSTRGARGR